MRLRTYVATAVAAMAAGALAMPATAGAQGDPASSDTTTPTSILAIVDAGGGRFTPTRLTLTDVAPQALWFSDRPRREAGRYTIPELIDTFFTDQTPPNAALEVEAAGDENDVVVVELSNPRYKKGAKELRFDSKVIGTPDDELGADSSLGGFADRHDGKVAKTFDDATLFVDSAAPSGAGCTGTNADGTSAEITILSSMTCAEAQAVIAQLENGECPENFGENWICGSSPTGTYEILQDPAAEFTWAERAP